MKVNCEIDTVNTLKKGMKIVLSIPHEERQDVLKQIHNFMDKPIIVDFQIDTKEQMERLNQISAEQRKKIYALIRDIANYIGDSVDNTKENLKIEFVQQTEYEMFSLSNCSSELAGEFIDFLINFAFENGVPMAEHPFKRADDIERYLAACLRHRACCVCGSRGEVHHVDAIGMGRNRAEADDSWNRKICLCRRHHSEAHTIGMAAFEDRYYVHGIVWEGQ